MKKTYQGPTLSINYMQDVIRMSGADNLAVYDLGE